MTDIADWLRAKGLEKLIDTFARNDIDFEVLPRLTDQDFKELGLSLGHRKKLLSAVAKDPATFAEAGHSGAAAFDRSRGAERRQLTVMFCDLVESTALSDRLDPEDLTFILQSYKSCCAQFIGRFGGTISNYMGDGILACFGYPSAHEDDAERAVHAALAITKAVSGLRLHREVILHTRIGIATGKVIVGDLEGHGIDEEGAIIGSTTNLAARLQSAAPADGIVIASSTRKLIGGLFELVSLGPLDLKGFAQQVQAWGVLGESSLESRFEAMHPTGAGPMIGRQAEIGALRSRWETAKQGQGRVVVISGEPGIGKSRLVSELREQLASESCFRLSYFGSEHHHTNALYPVITQIERNAGIARDDDDEKRLSKLEAFLASTSMSHRVQALAKLLSIPTAPRHPPLSLSPAELKTLIFESVIGRFETLCLERPVLLVVEDFQWIDPTSIELVEQLVERIKNLNVLIVITLRPGGELPACVGKDHVTHLVLERLSRDESLGVVKRIVGAVPLTDEVVDQIIAKADGVPLYHEELTKTVLESEAIAAKEDQAATLAVPATLHDSLMARLDRMFSAKQIAQFAATIGRTFSRDLLCAACGAPEDIVDSALLQLVASGIVSRQNTNPELTYQFKHALLQDVAYQSLLREVRRAYHRNIARALSERFPHAVEVQPELLAYHHAEAGQTAQAITYWKRAGKRATERSANVEATTQFQSALRLVPDLPAGEDKVREEYEILMGLIPALLACKGYSSPELESAISRALHLSNQMGGTSQIFPLLFSQYAYHLMTGQIRRALELAREFSLASGSPDVGGPFDGKRMAASCQFFMGDASGARQALDDHIAGYQLEKNRQSAFSYGHDLLVSSLGISSLLYWHLGLVDEAMNRYRRTLEHAQLTAHLNSLGAGLFYSAELHALCRNGEQVRVLAEQLASLGDEHKLVLWAVVGAYFSGWALSEAGDLSQGCTLMEEALQRLKTMRQGHFRPIFLTWLASVYCRMGQKDRGVELLEEARSIMDSGGECWMESEYYIVRSQLMMLPGQNRTPAEEVEDCAREAVKIAQAQKSPAMEARSAVNLANIWIASGRSREASSLLRQACEAIPNGQDSRDFSETRALLAQLGELNLLG